MYTVGWFIVVGLVGHCLLSHHRYHETVKRVCLRQEQLEAADPTANLFTKLRDLSAYRVGAIQGIKLAAAAAIAYTLLSGTWGK